MADVTQMTEEFSITECLLLLNGVLPAQGDITAVRLVRKLREALSFTEDEHKALNIRTEAGGIRWDDPDGYTKSVQLGPKMRETLVQGLKKLSDEKQLTEQHLGLYDRFVEDAAANA